MRIDRQKRPNMPIVAIALVLIGLIPLCAAADSFDGGDGFDAPSVSSPSSVEPAQGQMRIARSLLTVDQLFHETSDPRFPQTTIARASIARDLDRSRFPFKLISHEFAQETAPAPGTILSAPPADDFQPYDDLPTSLPAADNGYGRYPIDDCDCNNGRDCDNCDRRGRLIKQDCFHEVENWSPIAQFFGFGCHQDPCATDDLGIGHERVMFAPFEIDPTQPTNFAMVRYDTGFGLMTPNRAEYFWSKPGKGPSAPPNSIDYQDLRFVSEVGTDSASVQTELPVRFLESYSGQSTSGMGDMKIATKLRLLNGKKWQLTQIFRTYINTGSASKGVGAGHVSLEPGLLGRFEINKSTYVHGQAKYWIPIAADTGFAGNVLNYGVGISHVLYETNNFAIIPDLEMVNYNFLMGSKTFNGFDVNSSGEVAYNVIPGARVVFGPKGDLGLFELGVSNMIGIGPNRYVDNLLRVDFKFIY